jgi:hypothetical protein
MRHRWCGQVSSRQGVSKAMLIAFGGTFSVHGGRATGGTEKIKCNHSSHESFCMPKPANFNDDKGVSELSRNAGIPSPRLGASSGRERRRQSSADFNSVRRFRPSVRVRNCASRAHLAGSEHRVHPPTQRDSSEGRVEAAESVPVRQYRSPPSPHRSGGKARQSIAPLIRERV